MRSISPSSPRPHMVSRIKALCIHNLKSFYPCQGVCVCVHVSKQKMVETHYVLGTGRGDSCRRLQLLMQRATLLIVHYYSTLKYYVPFWCIFACTDGCVCVPECVCLCKRRFLDYIKELSFDPLEMKPSAVSVYQTSVISSTVLFFFLAFSPCVGCVRDDSFLQTISVTR